MTQTRSNLVLIGMPGSGKSTVGVILAKKTSCDFVDTDVLIQTSQERTLQDIVDIDGYAVLRKIEEDVLLGLSVHNHVIATGGSAAYSDQAMAHLKTDGVLIFLDADLAMLESRIPDFSTRGLAKRPDQSFAELFGERFALYTEHADITIKCAGLTQEDVCARIIEETERQSGNDPKSESDRGMKYYSNGGNILPRSGLLEQGSCSGTQKTRPLKSTLG